ncbi:uncharacterized protein LOC129760299 isoform X2 [Uranotaenia lowii]|uniref:uncharacterized protein LOC129760299 isoform X2 n=1 Tax=Uranotaenia lowii TaxID=190385 RepID=UPI00247ADB78|nr:uncharacterized protein LOC129760299 isoform X2 [Uranotaenia lowii]
MTSTKTSLHPLLSSEFPVSTIVPGKLSPLRKASSPYSGGGSNSAVPSSAVRIRYAKSPISKVSRNNTFIAPSRRSEQREPDGQDLLVHLLPDDDDAKTRLGKTKCSSAGAVEGKREPQQLVDDHVVVDIFKGATLKFSGSEEDQLKPSDTATSSVIEKSSPPVNKKVPRRLPVQSKSNMSRSIKAQRCLIGTSDAKTIKFLLKLTTKSYFEALKFEIDRLKENDRKMQEQTSSHARSIIALISRGIELDRKMEQLQNQSTSAMQDAQEKDNKRQEAIKTMSAELNEMKSVCNLLLTSIEKDHQLKELAQKLQISEQFEQKKESRKAAETKIERKKSMSRNLSRKSLSKKNPKKQNTTRAKSESLINQYKSIKHLHPIGTQKQKDSKVASVKSKSDWSSVSRMSTITTGSDMLTDLEFSSSEGSRKLKPNPPQSSEVAVRAPNLAESKNEEKRKTSIFRIFCCGKRSKKMKSKFNKKA